MKGRDALIVGWLVLPVTTAILAMGGYACGIELGKAHAPVALLIASIVVYWAASKCKWKVLAWMWLGVLASIALSGLFVLYTVADAEAYHRPALVLLANGWNPLQQTEVSQISGLMGGGFRPWHVAFLPRMGWIFGATLYHWFGFIEVADAMNVLMFVTSVLAVYEMLADWCVKRLRLLWTVLICVSPIVANGIWGGMVDSAWYSAFLVTVASVQRRQLWALMLSVVVMSGLKFTGVVVGAMIFASYGIYWIVVARNSERLRVLAQVFICGLATGALILLTNLSPYVTSWKNHGGPFYPSHSFVKSERFADDKNPITNDFAAMNDDAREIGYFGRLAWAYVSQDICKCYYRHKTGRENFNPDFKVNNGVGGFGAIFRMCFIFSLVAWPFIQKREIHLLMGFILLTVLIQPTTFSGYARYVPQFYLLPLLALIGLALRFGFPGLSGALGVCYGITMLIYPLSFLALQWIVSVQNLQIFDAIAKHNGCDAWAENLGTKNCLTHDLGTNVNLVDEVSLLSTNNVYGSYFQSYKCHIPDEIEGFYDLHHHVGRNNSRLKASRNMNLIKFFVDDFLSREFMCIPQRVWQILKLRYSQCISKTYL